MIIKTFDNGDYITLERSADPNGVCRQKIKELYTRYDKNGNFICSWWEYIQC
jgi:hypothetical protein